MDISLNFYLFKDAGSDADHHAGRLAICLQEMSFNFKRPRVFD